MKNKLFSALVAAALLLCGCYNTNVPGENESQETAVQAPADLCLYENGAPIYSIVRPDAKNDAISEVVSTLWKTLMNTYECELTTTSDWVADPSEIPTDSPEILIGMTNRPESAEIASSLSGFVYRVTVLNNRIVILASSDSALKLAANAFLDTVTVDENGRVTVPADLDISCTNEQVWKFDYIPVYDGGVYNGLSADCNTGFIAADNPSHIFGISQTNAEEFNAYIEKVKAEGFTVVQRADWGNVLAYQCDKDDVSFYTYYTDGTKEVRIIDDNSATVSLEEFSYTAEPVEGASNDIYLYSLKMAPNKDYNGNPYADCGLFMFMKLADNSLFVIDGGHTNQVDPAEFLRLAREVTGTPEGEKVRVSCWFITHCHSDHMNGFRNILKTNSDALQVERIMYNFMAGGHDINLSESNPDILYHKPHTGETISFGNVTMDVLYTQEDSMNITTMEYIPGESNGNGPENNACAVLKIHFDGKTFLVLGDIANTSSDVIESYYTADQLKSDVMQAAHHSLNPLHTFYEKIDPKIVLNPQNKDSSNPTVQNVFSSLESIADEVYYAGNETVGVRVTDGEAAVFYRAPIVLD